MSLNTNTRDEPVNATHSYDSSHPETQLSRMPFEITWEKHGFYFQIFGHFGKREMLAKNSEFSNDSRSNNSRYQIVDGSEIESIELSDHDITTLASHDIGSAFYLKNISVALVGSNRKLKEIYQRYISICQKTDMTWKFYLCDTLEQARYWLRSTQTPSTCSSLAATGKPFSYSKLRRT